MSTDARVSVVIPAHNAEGFIVPTIESALTQDFGDVEVVVVDDGSSDSTAEVVRRLGSRVRLLEGGGRGVSAARNLGIEQSAGEYVAFLDHDDLWDRTKLGKQVARFEANPSTTLVFTQAVPLEDDTEGEPFPVLPDGPAFLANAYQELAFWNFVPMSTAVVRRDVLARLPRLFDTRLKLSEDWEFWLRIAEVSGPEGVAFVAEPLATYVIHPGRATERMADMRLEDLRVFALEVERNPWLRSVDPVRYRRFLYKLHEETGYWLLREGRASEAVRHSLRAWRLRPWTIKTLARVARCWLHRARA